MASYQEQLAASMLGNSLGTQATTPTQGVAQLGQTALASLLLKRTQAKSDSESQKRTQALAKALGVDLGEFGGMSLETPELVAIANANKRDVDEFGNPVAGIDAEGNPTFMQFSKTGNARPVAGFRPPPKDTKTDATWTLLSAEEKRTRGIPATMVAQRNDRTGEIKTARTGAEVNVNNNLGSMEGEASKAEGKAVGDYLGNFYVKTQESGEKSYADDIRLNRFEQLLNTVGKTGPGADTMVNIKSFAKARGIDLEAIGVTDNVAPAEALRSLSNQMALEGVGETKGAISDKEMAFFQEIAPSLARTIEGNRLIIDLRRNINKRSREVAKLANKYRSENRTMEGFGDVLERYHAENPLFGDDITQKIQAATDGPIPQPGGDVSTMSDEDLLRVLGLPASGGR